MPLLFVFPNQSHSRTSVALLGHYLKRQAISRAWCVHLCSELNLTSSAARSLEGPGLRGKRNCILLLAHLKCVWPFESSTAPGRSSAASPQPGQAGRQGARGACSDPQWVVLGALHLPLGTGPLGLVCFLAVAGIRAGLGQHHSLAMPLCTVEPRQLPV